ncbi:G-patch domain-containing protein [Golovinomyces cichoracearum]|uniref:G-patch domain-containing protein n=1 Tax=Golovinomyces cichoracearum TaxID=62708 RepID=A0A420IJT3_9PEZI|nr:G-patch domain-containing protein [Golovinomyces cichoracearum]
MSHPSSFVPRSWSETSNEENVPPHQANYNDEYDFQGFNSRKKRRIHDNSKEKSALGIFGSDSEDERPGKKWKKSNLRRKGVSFVSNVEHSMWNEDNEDNYVKEKENFQINNHELGTNWVESRNPPSTNEVNSFTSELDSRYSTTSPLSLNLSNHGSDNISSTKINKTSKNQNKVPNVNGGSFAARMMAKMGYKQGEGLGKEGKGRSSVIEVTLRPQGVGLGAIKEKSKQEIEEEERRGKSTEKNYGDTNRRKKNPLNQSASQPLNGHEETMSKKKDVPKQKFRTISEINHVAPGLHIPESFVSILDMTTPGRNVINSTAGLLAVDNASEIKENNEINKLTQSAKNDLFAYVEEWKILEERKTYNKHILVQKRQEIKEEQERFESMQTFANKIQALSQLVKDMEWDQVFESLQTIASMPEVEHPDRSQELSKIIVAVVHPYLRRSVEDWKPLEDPKLRGFVPQLFKLREILGVSTNDIKSTVSPNPINEEVQVINTKTCTAYDSMIFSIIYPKILSSIEQKWDVYDPTALQALLTIWDGLLPSFVRSLILNQAVVRKLNSAVTSWNPRKRKTYELPHLWLFPWLQYLPAYHTDPKSSNGLVSDIKRKFRQLLDSWDFHKGVVPGLHQWRELLYSSPSNDQWTPLIMNHVLPSMYRFLKNEDNFMVNPNDQAPFMSSLLGIFKWQNIINSKVVAQVMVETVFPRWHDVLYQWLIDVGPNEEIGQWFKWWRSEVFPDDINSLKVIQDEFDKGHNLIEQALDLGSRVSELLPVPKTKIHEKDPQLKPTTSPIPLKSEDNTFKHTIEDWCIENDLQFIPEKKIFHSTGPLNRVTAAGNGKNGVLVLIKGDQIFALSKRGSEYVDIKIDWESTDARDLLLGMAWQNVK